MKKRYPVAIIAALTLTLTGVAASQAGSIAPPPKQHVVPATCTFKEFKPFATKVWKLSKWERKEPKQAVIDAQRRRLDCAPPAHRKEMKEFWRDKKKEFYQHRAKQLFRVRITPFSCGGSWWATPCEIPLHESGYCTGGSNCYGMLDAWYVHGCTEFAPSGFGAPMKAQHICAHRHYATYGRGGWPSY